jgi:hypothetical protein
VPRNLSFVGTGAALEARQIFRVPAFSDGEESNPDPGLGFGRTPVTSTNVRTLAATVLIGLPGNVRLRGWATVMSAAILVAFNQTLLLRGLRALAVAWRSWMVSRAVLAPTWTLVSVVLIGFPMT